MKIKILKGKKLKEDEIIDRFKRLLYKKRKENMNQFKFDFEISKNVLDVIEDENVQKENPDDYKAKLNNENSIREDEIVSLLDFKKLFS